MANETSPSDWSIQEIARLAGTTSRTLRHYGDIELLKPSRVGGNGYRYYDQAALVRLQRILLLRELGLGLSAIGDILAGAAEDEEALAGHLRWLKSEQNRIALQIVSVETTMRKIAEGQQLMADEILNGFDHTRHKQEVEERWGADAYAASDAWWSAKSADEKARWQSEQKKLASDWADAAAREVSADGDEAQALAARQYAWLAGIPGTPRDANGPTKEYFEGLGELYVADGRFAANYGGAAGASFVRDAMRVYGRRHLV